MSIDYQKINWQNGSTGKTPLNAGSNTANLNRMDNALEAVCNEVDELSNYQLIAEGYSSGTENGTPVEEGSTYYHNNAKYYSEQSSTYATNASTSATASANSATASANSATESANSASKSATETAKLLRNQMQGYVEVATDASESASKSATDAKTSKEEANQEVIEAKAILEQAENTLANAEKKVNAVTFNLDLSTAQLMYDSDIYNFTVNDDGTLTWEVNE